MIHKTVSLADQIFERLESEILTGVYPRGAILTELSLSEDLEVSRTPVREAVRRLEQEHLVESSPKGIVVLSITLEDALIIYEIRVHAEGLAARAAASKATPEQMNEMKDLLELQEFFIRKGDSERVKDTDSQFHQLIYSFTGSPVYADVLTPLHNKTQKFRKTTMSVTSRANLSFAEHKRIYEAILSGDPEAAEVAMREHVERAKARLIQAANEIDK